MCSNHSFICRHYAYPLCLWTIGSWQHCWLNVTWISIKIALSNFICFPKRRNNKITLVLTRMSRWRPKFLGHASHYHRSVLGVDSFMIHSLFALPDAHFLVVIEQNTFTRNTKLFSNPNPMFPLLSIEITPINYYTATSAQGLTTSGLTCFSIPQRVLIYPDVRWASILQLRSKPRLSTAWNKILLNQLRL